MKQKNIVTDDFYLITNKEGYLYDYVLLTDFPDEVIQSHIDNRQAKDWRDKDKKVCGYEHPLPCGLDNKCKLWEDNQN